MSKDLFSTQAKTYSLYRPHYPDALFDYIISFVTDKNIALDCATGNGQAAVKLADYFSSVKAIDISKAQLGEAVQKPNIEYLLSSAENTPFNDDTFDLITVAQAYHWFQHDIFNNEMHRIGKNGSIVAIWFYERTDTGDTELDNLLHHFYKDITGPYWDEGRQFVDNQYASLPFPYEPIPATPFTTTINYTLDQLKGYLTSWSAVQKFIKVNGYSPLTLIEEKLQTLWGNEKTKAFPFAIYLKIGRIKK